MTGKIRNKPVLLSIIICTHNRLDDLINVLESLKNQVLNREDVELIIVDNRSHDGTSDFLLQYCRQGKNIKSTFESEIGLSNARNRGWKEAVGKFVGYSDDDALIPPEWVSTALEIIHEEKYPLFGGPYYPFYKNQQPNWFKDKYGSSYWLPDKECVLDGRYLVGGNMFIRRDILEKLGGFSDQYGMSGGNLGYNEETIFQIRLLQSDPHIKIFYTPRLYIKHLVSDQKMDPLWAIKRYLKQGNDRFRFERTEPSKKFESNALFNLIKLPLLLCFGIVDLGILILFRNRKKYPYWQNYIYERGKRYADQVGYAMSALGFKF